MAILSLYLQNGTYPARYDRLMLERVFGGREMAFDGLVVTQNGAGNLSVNVSAGAALIKGDDQTDQGMYLVIVDTLTNLVMPAAPGTNKRIDLVSLKVNDPQAGGSVGDNSTLVVTQGTAAATPVAPTPPLSAIVLRKVLRTAGDPAVLTAHLQADELGRGRYPYEVGTAAPPAVLPPRSLYVRRSV